MATLNGWSSQKGYGFWLDVSEYIEYNQSDPNYYITSNKSRVDFALNIQNNGSRTDSSGWTIVVNIDGTNVIYDSSYHLDTYKSGSAGRYEAFTLVTGSVWITHNNNGSRSVSCSASLYRSSGSYASYEPGQCGVDAQSVQLTTIPRYTSITSYTLSAVDEENINVSWTASDACDSVQYKIIGISSNWVQASGNSFNIGGLTGGTKYYIQIRVKRTSSQLWTESGTDKYVTTVAWPYIKSGLSAFTIGNNFTINLENPKGRTCSIKFIADNNTNKSKTGITGTTVSGFNSNDWVTFLNNSLPSKTKGQYRINLTCSYNNVEKVNANYGPYEYSINTNDSTYKPVFTDSNITSFSNIDTDTVNISGANKFIKGHNKLQATFTSMNAQKGSSGNYYDISSAGVQTQRKQYSSNPITFTMDDLTVNNFTITAFDSRNLWTAVTKNINLVDYSNPTIDETNVSITRQNVIGDKAVININGGYTNWSNLSQNNRIQSIKYRVGSSGSFNSLPSGASITYQNGNWSLSTILNDTFSTSSSYQLYFQVTDLLESSVFGPYTLNTADAFVWKDLQNRRIGINKKPDYTFDINGHLNVVNNAYVNGDVQGRDLLSTRNILPTGQVIKNKTGSWISDRDNSPVANKNTGTNGGYAPACSVKTKNGNWTIGVIDNQDTLYFNYTTDTNYANGTNQSTVWRLPVRGTNLNSTENLALLAYPVGSIYISAVATNPGTIFGGTWQQLKNRYLFATNSTSGNKGKDAQSSTTGVNAKSHTLTINEIPAHDHIIYTPRYYYSEPGGGSDILGADTNPVTTVQERKTGATGGSGGHTHNVPYIEVYVWQRTA